MLKESQIKVMLPRDARYMQADVDGLYIEVFPNGRKVFLLRTTVGGNRRKFVLGDWPKLSLRDARAACTEKRSELERLSGAASKGTAVFGDLVWEWFDIAMANGTEKYRKWMEGLIRARVLPRFEGQLAGNISALDILSRIRDIEEHGAHEVAHRVLSVFNRVFLYGINKTVLDSNPAGSLLPLLTPRRVKHFARLTDPREVGRLMRAIEGYSSVSVRNALLFSAYSFGRPGEVRGALW